MAPTGRTGPGRVDEPCLRRALNARSGAISLARAGLMVSAAGSGEERCHDVRGVSVKGDSGPVVAHRGARIGVAGGFLHIPQRNPSVESGRDECVAARVGPDALGDPGPSSDTPHDPSGRMAIDPSPVRSEENRALAAFADRQIDGPGCPRSEGDSDDLATFAQDRERAMAPLKPEVLDVSSYGL